MDEIQQVQLRKVQHLHTTLSFLRGSLQSFATVLKLLKVENVENAVVAAFICGCSKKPDILLQNQQSMKLALKQITQVIVARWMSGCKYLDLRLGIGTRSTVNSCICALL